jgi:hypothetical protein
MGESPEKQALVILTASVAKTLNRLNKILQQKQIARREVGSMTRLVAELEISNDEIMRSVLDLNVQQMVRLKTGQTARTPKTQAEKQRGNDNSELMKFHYEHLKGHRISDGGAQGSAIKWLLDNGYSLPVLKECYESLFAEKWRSNVSWLTVRKEIGPWITRGNRTAATKTDRSVENGHTVAAEYRNEVIH